MISYLSKCWSYCKNLFSEKIVLVSSHFWLGNELLGKIVFKERDNKYANCQCFFFPADYERAYTRRELRQVQSFMRLIESDPASPARVSDGKVYSVLKAGDNYRCDKLLGTIVEGKFVPYCILDIHELASVIDADWNENAYGLLDQIQVDLFEGVE